MQSHSNFTLSIIIPVYKSEAMLHKLAETLAEVMPQITPTFEVILVEDDGGDRSWQIIEELIKVYPWIRGIKMMRNYGQHAALLAGIRVAKYDIVVTMDDDLQHPPEEIRKLLTRLDEGYDVVYGSPREKQHNLWRNLASGITRFALGSAMGADAARNASAFRAFRTRLRDAFSSYNSPFVAIDVLLTWGTVRFSHIEVEHRPRYAGTSTYTFRKLVTHAITMMTGFSTIPLRVASFIGFAMTVFGILILIYVIGRFVIEQGSVPGFPFLASIIAIFSGTQLFVIGIFGEYLARMHFRLMDKPAYVIRETTPEQP